VPKADDPLYRYVIGTPGLQKLGLLYGSTLYEVQFDEEGRPVAGEMALKVLQMRLPLATAMDGVMILISQGPLRLFLGRDDQGKAQFRDRIHMKGLAARHNGWFGLSREELLEAFELDRRLKVIARPGDCHHIDACEGLIGRWSLPEPQVRAI
jgi:hypothetical protein